jgi:limonene-1,2-epoxide hydrolase
MKRHNIEFVWGWLDALRRRDTESMAAALDPAVVWQGVRPDLVCHGPDEVIAAFLTAYDANQEIDSLELLGGDGHVVLGTRARELRIADVATGGEIYNVFTTDGDKITRIQDYLQRDDALLAARLTSEK